MFDWNDEELVNIVWGDEGQSDDHIVPYPEASEDLHKKEWNQESSPFKLAEQKRDFHGRKLGSSSKFHNSAAKTDHGSLGTEVSKNLEETTQLEKDQEFFQNTHEGKEQGDIVDYGWANIGSFDDLDQIFSNDDSIFGHASLESSDELWSSKEDMIGRTTSVTSALAAETTAKGFTNKGKQDGKLLQNFHGNWSPLTTPSGQFGNQLAPSAMKSSTFSILGQQKQLQGPGTLYQNITHPYVASSVCGNPTYAYPAMSMLPQAQSGDIRGQTLLPGYEVSPEIVNPVKKSVDSLKPLTMTPQEKIEKLRRRQQMQAMLAIQKQQQQLDHQVPSSYKSMTQKCPLEKQSYLCDGADPEIQDLRTLPALDPPTEQGDSNTISVAIGDHFVEDTILYMLQDIISKLDVKIRLCIRDSLFRLAQSAMQRNYASATSSTNKRSREELEVVAREDHNSQNRYARISDVETETNPIDRTVAHLLFHRPLELTGNYSDKLDSPISAKMQCESKAANLENFPVGCLPDEDLKSNQQFSHQGFKKSCSFFDAQPMDQFKNSPCMDTSENASNMEPADVGAQELEAFQ